MEWDKVKDVSMAKLWEMLENDPAHYRDYSSLYTYKNSNEYGVKVFSNLFGTLGLDLKGLNYLELGPGSGEGLDVAKSRGAKTSFIDRDVLIARHCELKGHKLILCDYATKDLLKLNINADVIVARGALNFDYWDRNQYAIEFDKLINWMLGTGAKTIVITPAWERGGKEPYYACNGDKLANVDNMGIVKTLYKKGFKRVEIDGYQWQPHLPISFIWSAKDVY